MVRPPASKIADSFEPLPAYPRLSAQANRLSATSRIYTHLSGLYLHTHTPPSSTQCSNTQIVIFISHHTTSHLIIFTLPPCSTHQHPSCEAPLLTPTSFELSLPQSHHHLIRQTQLPL